MLVMTLYSVICGDSFSHLWYLYALIGTYMILPILKAFVDSDKEGKGLAVALVLLLVFDFVCPLVEGLTGGEIAFYIPMTYTIFYLLLGHYMVIYKMFDVRADRGSYPTDRAAVRNNGNIWCGWNDCVI